MVVKEKEGRDFVHEIKSGSVVIEIYRKTEPHTGRVYFDYRVGREFFVGDDETARGPFCQQRDLRDNVRALIDVQEWVSSQHRDIRNNSY